MKKKLNILFCENLVKSDFLFLYHKVKNLALLKLGNLKTSLFVLNILNLFKELKQLIRLFSFLSRSSKNELILYIKNSPFYFLANKYFININTKLKMNLLKNYTVQQSSKDKTKMLLSLSNMFSNNKELLNSNYLLSVFIELNTVPLKKTSFYKVFNLIDTNKKMFFILALLEIIFSKK